MFPDAVPLLHTLLPEFYLGMVLDAATWQVTPELKAGITSLTGLQN